MVLSSSSREHMYETKFNIKHNKIVKKNLQFNQLVFSIYYKTKSTRESLAFEIWMFIFAATDFSLERKVHHHNFEFVDK